MSSEISSPEKMMVFSDLSGQEILKIVSGPPATILLGPEAKPYTISRELLCRSSRYFRDALNGSFIEGTTQTVILEQFSVETFDIVVKYLLTGTVRCTEELEASEASKRFRTLMRFLICVDYLSLPIPSDILDDEMVELLDKFCIEAEELQLAMALPSDSLVRRLAMNDIASQYLSFLRDKDMVYFVFEEELENLEGFTAELLGALTREVKAGRLSLRR